MKRLIASTCLLVVLGFPSLAPAVFFPTFFPPSANFAGQVATPSSADGIHHNFLGVNLLNLDLFFVSMLGSNGIPDPAFAWLYGRVVLVEQLGPTTFRVTWNVSASTGGVNAVFVPAGQIILTFTL
jgi:hypothetical protein